MFIFNCKLGIYDFIFSFTIDYPPPVFPNFDIWFALVKKNTVEQIEWF